MRNALILLACLLLSACGQPPLPLHIGTNVWIGYEPLYLARSLNLLSPQDAHLVEYTSATQVMEAFKDGAIDAAALTLDEALLLQQNGLDARVVLAMDYSHGADALLARPGFGSLKALKGHRIGVEDTALGAYMLDRALHKAGMDHEDVQVVPMGVNEHEDAFMSGKVEAVVTFEPVTGKLMRTGALKLFDSAQIPGEIMDVLVVRADFSSHSVSQVQGVLKAWFGALDYISRQPAAAAQLMAPRLGLDAEHVREASRGIRIPDRAENRRLLLSRPPPLERQAGQLARVMTAHNLATGLRPGALFEERMLKELYQ